MTLSKRSTKRHVTNSDLGKVLSAQAYSFMCGYNHGSQNKKCHPTPPLPKCVVKDGRIAWTDHVATFGLTKLGRHFARMGQLFPDELRNMRALIKAMPHLKGPK